MSAIHGGVAGRVPFRRRMTTRLAAPPVIGALVFTLGWLVAGELQDYYDPRRDYISSLAAVDAADPWIMIAAMVAFGIGVVSLGVGLACALPGRLGRAGAVGVTLSGLGVLAIAAMRHDCGLQFPSCSARVGLGEMSIYHLLHDVASAWTFVVAGVSQLVIAAGMRRWQGWQRLHGPSLASGAVTLALFVIIASDRFPEWAGAIQRTITIEACLWVSIIAWHLYRYGVAGRGQVKPRRAGHAPAEQIT